MMNWLEPLLDATKEYSYELGRGGEVFIIKELRLLEDVDLYKEYVKCRSKLILHLLAFDQVLRKLDNVKEKEKAKKINETN